jgi:hypothetical protein
LRLFLMQTDVRRQSTLTVSPTKHRLPFV